jgi:hypothetical protein
LSDNSSVIAAESGDTGGCRDEAPVVPRHRCLVPPLNAVATKAAAGSSRWRKPPMKEKLMQGGIYSFAETKTAASQQGLKGTDRATSCRSRATATPPWSTRTATSVSWATASRAPSLAQRGKLRVCIVGALCRWGRHFACEGCRRCSLASWSTACVLELLTSHSFLCHPRRSGRSRATCMEHRSRAHALHLILI